MANVLEEYLVSIKYVVDSTSEGRLLDGLKKFAQSTLGVNTGIIGLIGTMTELVKKIGEVGERWYWMSQQLGQSAGELIVASDAMVALGMSTSAAVGSLQAFQNWTLTMGPGATAFMRSIGVTATDLHGRLMQLGPVLRGMGGADPNNPNYWRALQFERIMGISPEMGLRLARGDFASEEARRRQIGANVFGVQPGQYDTQMAQFTSNAQKMMQIFHEFGFAFQDMMKYMGAQIFPRLIPIFEHLFKLMQQYMPDIREFLRVISKIVVEVFSLTDAAVTLGAALIHGFSQLPGLFKAIEGAMIVLGARMLLSPAGRMIAALSFLLLLMEDYLVWERKGKSAFDWSDMHKHMTTKPQDRTWIQWLLHAFGQLADYALIIDGVFGFKGIRTIAAGIGRLFGRLGITRLLGMIAGRGAAGAVAGAAAGAAGAAALPEILIAAAIAALIYGAAELVFNSAEVKDVLKKGAEGFWDFITQLFQNQDQADPTSHSVAGPQTLLGRITMGASGLGPSGDPAKESEVMGILMGKYGLSKEDAAAWVSNWEAESQLRPDITYGGGGYNPDSSRAYGLMQWTGPRLAHLREYAKEHNEDIRLLNTQLEFWWHELHNDPTYKNVLAHVAAAQGRAKAEVVFHEGESGWDPGLEHYLPDHLKGFARLAGMPDVAPVSGTGGKGSPVVQNNYTDISVAHGPNAASTAAAVAGHQDQVNREAVRTLRGAAVR